MVVAKPPPLDTLRKFMHSGSWNRRCADCIQPGPCFVCIPLRTFVCSQCAGIHREFNRRVKGISMSKWTDEEIKDIMKGGNDVARNIYMHKWSASIYKEPNASDETAVRDIINKKYTEELWKRDMSQTTSTESASISSQSSPSSQKSFQMTRPHTTQSTPFAAAPSSKQRAGPTKKNLVSANLHTKNRAEKLNSVSQKQKSNQKKVLPTRNTFDSMATQNSHDLFESIRSQESNFIIPQALPKALTPKQSTPAQPAPPNSVNNVQAIQQSYSPVLAAAPPYQAITSPEPIPSSHSFTSNYVPSASPLNDVRLFNNVSHSQVPSYSHEISCDPSKAQPTTLYPHPSCIPTFGDQPADKGQLYNKALSLSFPRPPFVNQPTPLVMQGMKPFGAVMPTNVQEHYAYNQLNPSNQFNLNCPSFGQCDSHVVPYSTHFFIPEKNGVNCNFSNLRQRAYEPLKSITNPFVTQVKSASKNPFSFSNSSKPMLSSSNANWNGPNILYITNAHRVVRNL